VRLVVLLLVIAGCGDADRSNGSGGERPAQPAPDRTHEGPRAVADRGYIGVIAARESTDVSSRLEGEIAEVHVRIGDAVAAGDPIATIENRKIKEEIAVTLASIRSARAAVAQAKVEVDASKEALAIEQEAFDKGTSSRRDLTDAQFRHRKAIAAHSAALASVGEQQAHLAQLRQRLGQAKVTAPFAGTIALRHLDPGATVVPGTPIVRLITSSELWVKFAVPGSDAARLAVGDKVKVELESLDATVLATIEQIAPEVEPNSQMIIVEAELAAPGELEDRLQSGLVARVRPQ
jgi:RND family efflux transporter MFP subunit